MFHIQETTLPDSVLQLFFIFWSCRLCFFFKTLLAVDQFNTNQKSQFDNTQKKMIQSMFL